jgi:hypothetical protein
VLVLYIRKCLQSRAFLKWAPLDSPLASAYFGSALLLKCYPTLSSIGSDSKNATTSLPIKLNWVLPQIYLWRKVVGLFCFSCWDLPNHSPPCSTLVLLESPWRVGGALRWFHNVSTYGEIIGCWTFFPLKIHLKFKTVFFTIELSLTKPSPSPNFFSVTSHNFPRLGRTFVCQ